MSSRISIFDKSGSWLTEVNATCRRSWKLNEYGIATLEISTSDQKAQEKYLRFGNLIYVEHDKLPVWAGMIDTPRAWGKGVITVTAYGGEYIMTTRITGKTLKVSGTYGSCYQQILDSMYSESDYNLVTTGTIYGGGGTMSTTYHWENVYTVFKKLASESGHDWNFEPVFDANGRLYFEAHWYERRGSRRTFTLYEDMHIELLDIGLREQGTIGNRVRVFGNGANWSEMPAALRNDEESKAKYGTRYTAEYANVSTSDQLGDIADAKILYYKEPRKTFSINLLDVGQAFGYARIGDILPVSFYSCGFTGSQIGTSADIRILQMDYNENTNTLKVVSDEWREPNE